jgi:hypothetical protein
MALSIRCYAPDVHEACNNPAYDQCPICPYGAIKIDVGTGNCSVRASLCRGQSHRTRRRGRYNGPCDVEQIESTVCWECFNPGDGITSTQCLKRRLQKTMHFALACCSDCPDCSKERSGGDDASEVCVPGAITWQDTGPYTVDTDRCTACMACINTIDCWLNVSEDPLHRPMRMVAHLKTWRWPLLGTDWSSLS